MQRVLIGDRSGRLIGELEPLLGDVTWRLNQVSSVDFTLAKTNRKVTEELLQYGNRFLIDFDNGLPPWGGVIEPPRVWTAGSVQATAYSADQVLRTRITDRGRYFSDAVVGYIFQQVIIETNTLEHTGINLGSIWMGGVSHYPDYHFERVLDIIQDSICTRMANVDYEIAASLGRGQIVLTANLYERMGNSKPNVALIEGKNLSKIELTEQGEIVNWVDLAGSGQDWGVNRIYSHAEDATSRGKYGLRQGAAIFNDVTIQATLDAHAVNMLNESKDPHALLELTALDKAPARFRDYGLGDSVRVILHSYGFGGFDGMVRVTGREFNPVAGTCRLAVRVE